MVLPSIEGPSHRLASTRPRPVDDRVNFRPSLQDRRPASPQFRRTHLISGHPPEEACIIELDEHDSDHFPKRRRITDPAYESRDGLPAGTSKVAHPVPAGIGSGSQQWLDTGLSPSQSARPDTVYIHAQDSASFKPRLELRDRQQATADSPHYRRSSLRFVEMSDSNGQLQDPRVEIPTRPHDEFVFDTGNAHYPESGNQHTSTLQANTRHPVYRAGQDYRPAIGRDRFPEYVHRPDWSTQYIRLSMGDEDRMALYPKATHYVDSQANTRHAGHFVRTSEGSLSSPNDLTAGMQGDLMRHQTFAKESVMRAKDHGHYSHGNEDEPPPQGMYPYHLPARPLKLLPSETRTTENLRPKASYHHSQGIYARHQPVLRDYPNHRVEPILVDEVLDPPAWVGPREEQIR